MNIKPIKSNDMKCVRMKDAFIHVDYIYLDSEERRRFAQVGHEYLIEQLHQYQDDNEIDNDIINDLPNTKTMTCDHKLTQINDRLSCDICCKSYSIGITI
jgi:hypothetical protein